MTDPEEVPPFRGEEDYVTLDTEQVSLRATNCWPQSMRC